MAYLPDLDDPSRIAIKDAQGNIRTVPREQLSQAIQQGYSEASDDEIKKERDRLLYEDKDLAAVATGAARGLTFGASDLALAGLSKLTDNKLGYSPEELRKIEEHNLGESIGGEIAGTAASFFIPGAGAANVAKAGRLARIARTAHKATRGATAAPRIASQVSKKLSSKITNETIRKATEAGTEGLMYGAGHLISRDAMEDPNLNAQYAMATLGLSALAGAAIPIAGAGISKAKEKVAPKLFLPRIGEHGLTLEEMVPKIHAEYRKKTEWMVENLTHKNKKSFLNVGDEIKDDFGNVSEVVSKPEIQSSMEWSDRLQAYHLSIDVRQKIREKNGDIFELSVFNVKRHFTPDGVALTSIVSDSIGGEGRGIGSWWYKNVDKDILSTHGYAGKPVSISSVNPRTASLFLRTFEDGTISEFSRPTLRKAAYVEGVSPMDLEDLVQSGKLKSKNLNGPDPYAFTTVQTGRIPKPKTVLDKVLGFVKDKSVSLTSKVNNLSLEEVSAIRQMMDPKGKDLADLLGNPKELRTISKRMAQLSEHYNNSLRDILDEIVGKEKAHKWDKLIIPEDLPEEQIAIRTQVAKNKALTILENIQLELSNMVKAGVGEYGYQADLKKLTKLAAAAKKGILEETVKDVQPITNVFYHMDSIKRDVGKAVERMMRRQNTSSADWTTLDRLAGNDGQGGIYERLRQHLMDQDDLGELLSESDRLYGRAADVQREINAAWTEFLDFSNFRKKPQFFTPMGKEGFRDSYRADPDAFESFLRDISAGKSALSQEWFENWFGASSKMLTVIEMLLSSGESKQFHKKLDSAFEAERWMRQFFTSQPYRPSLHNLRSVSVIGERSAQRSQSGLDAAIPYGVGAGVGFGVGTVGTGLAAAAVTKAAQEAGRTITDPAKLVSRYHAVANVANKLGRFSSTVAKRTAAEASKAVQTGFIPPIAAQAAQIPLNSLFRSLTDKDPNNDEEVLSLMDEISADPQNAIERIAENLSVIAQLDEEVAQALAAQSMEKLLFLRDKIEALSTSPVGGKIANRRISPFNKKKINNYVLALGEPLRVLDDLAMGKKPSNEQIEVLQRFHPDIWSQVQMTLMKDPSNKTAMKLLEKIGATSGVSVATIQRLYAPAEQQSKNAEFGPPQPLTATRLSTKG